MSLERILDSTDDYLWERNNTQSDDIQCPSCRGRGKIPREQESQMVAIIPIRDKRLKPRRTWLWVILTLFVCALLAGLLSFFLIPRTIKLHLSSRYINGTITLYNNASDFKESLVKLNTTIPYYLKNENYYPVYIKKVQTTVSTLGDYEPSVQVGHLIDKSEFEMPLKSSINHHLDVKAELHSIDAFLCPRSFPIKLVIGTVLYGKQLGYIINMNFEEEFHLNCISPSS